MVTVAVDRLGLGELSSHQPSGPPAPHLTRLSAFALCGNLQANARVRASSARGSTATWAYAPGVHRAARARSATAAAIRRPRLAAHRSRARGGWSTTFES